MKLGGLAASFFLFASGLSDSLLSWTRVGVVFKNKRTFLCLCWIILASIGLLWGMSLAIEEIAGKASGPLGEAATLYYERACHHYFDQKVALLHAARSAAKDFTKMQKDALVAVVLRLLYQCGLLLPVIVGCHLALGKWHQKLSDLMFIDTKKLELDAIAKYSDKREDRYCTAMVVVCTLLVQLYTTVMPIAFDFMQALPTSKMGSMVKYPHVWYTTVWLLRKLARMGGMVNQCLLYSWYLYNFHWITLGVSVGSRLDILERRWEYFLGFATPLVILLRVYSDYFVFNYGIYISALPLMIISSNICDYNRGYKVLTDLLEATLDPKNPINDPTKRNVFSGQFVMRLFTTRRGSRKFLEDWRKALFGTDHVHVDRILKRVHTFRTPNIIALALLRFLKQPGSNRGLLSVSGLPKPFKPGPRHTQYHESDKWVRPPHPAVSEDLGDESNTKNDRKRKGSKHKVD